MGRESVKQREDLPLPARSTLSQELLEYHQGDLQATFPSLRAYLSYSLSTYYVIECRNTFKHLLQGEKVSYYSIDSKLSY